MSRLLLVRHGQSTWNASGHWQGQADPPLTDLGREQAARAADRIVELLGGVVAVRASDLERAHHTARTIAAPHGVPVATDPRLRERDAGPWTGLTRAEIEERFPGFLGSGTRPDGYETDADVAERTLAALHDFADALAGGTGVLVTHGGVIVTLESVHGAERIDIANLGARWIERRPDGTFVLGERIELLGPELGSGSGGIGGGAER